jgi:hypothetical protein
MKLRADLILDEMANTFRERNVMYGDNWEKVANVLSALFPQGITLTTPEDFARFHFLDWTVGKFTRFVNTGMTHAESVHDGAVYMAMLEALLKLQEQEKNDVSKVGKRRSVRGLAKVKARRKTVGSAH